MDVSIFPAKRLDQADRLAGGQRFLTIRLCRCHNPQQKKEQMQVLRLVSLGNELLKRDKRRRLEQAARLPAELRDPAAPADQAALQITAMSPQREHRNARGG